MLSPGDIALAVGIQKRAFQLLAWLREAVDKGGITTSRTTHEESSAQVIREWIRNNWSLIPSELRPEESELIPFCNYFASYLTTSFDFLSDPGEKLISDGGTCFCEICTRLVEASHLQSKKLSRSDKIEAMDRCRDVVSRIAESEGFDLAAEELEPMVMENRRAAALTAYGISLLERIEGDPGGPYALALWRMFAWNEHGSPIKNFSLEPEAILEAEGNLVEIVRTRASRHRSGVGAKT